MNKKQTLELLENLKKWYQDNKNDPNLWNRNKIGLEIREIVDSADHWKGQRRGNPRKGGINSKLAQIKRQSSV